jgi:hypothetical protein
VKQLGPQNESLEKLSANVAAMSQRSTAQRETFAHMVSDLSDLRAQLNALKRWGAGPAGGRRRQGAGGIPKQRANGWSCGRSKSAAGPMTKGGPGAQAAVRGARPSARPLASPRPACSCPVAAASLLGDRGIFQQS